MPGSGQSGAPAYRSPFRVAILASLADPFYFFWWTYQFFKFTQREGFPRARSFWWILLPIFGLYVLWQQLDDLRKAAESTSSERVNPALVLGLIIGALAADRIFGGATDTTVALVTLLAGSVLIGAALYTAQSAVSSYLAAKYPFQQSRGMTVGETVATVLGILFTAVLLLAIFLPG
ncbi:MAG TPA: hypothetical protein VEQ12_11975 [Candidatus Limnocylindria bacterium]|nr:hypothetical protein [Candidatus Limnocylindria bacterium]